MNQGLWHVKNKRVEQAHGVWDGFHPAGQQPSLCHNANHNEAITNSKMLQSAGSRSLHKMPSVEFWFKYLCGWMGAQSGASDYLNCTSLFQAESRLSSNKTKKNPHWFGVFFLSFFFFLKRNIQFSVTAGGKQQSCVKLLRWKCFWCKDLLFFWYMLHSVKYSCSVYVLKIFHYSFDD